MEKKMVTITKKDCRRCRFVLVCTGAALFEQIPSLESMTFKDHGCPRDWPVFEEDKFVVQSSDSKLSSSIPAL